MTSNDHYDKRLKSFARNLRNNMTKAESRLWYEILCKKQMLGYKFLRQRPIDRYIADFFCKDLALIIEVDGATHDYEEVMHKDAIRQKRLEDLGYTVVRFSDWEVHHDLPGVVILLEEEMRKLMGK